MAGINLTSPSGYTTAHLIADTISVAGGSNDAISQMTQVNGVTVNAALEIQSTQGGLLIPRMTTTQRLALTTVVNGMEVFDSTLGSFMYYVNGAWSSSNALGGIQTATVILNQAAVQGMYAAPFAIVPAPAAGYSIVVNQATFVNNYVTAAFATGTAIALQYGTTVHGVGTNALTGLVAASLVTTASSSMISLAGSTSSLTGTAGLGLYLSNATGAFTAGNAASTLVVTVQYAVIAANV